MKLKSLVIGSTVALSLGMAGTISSPTTTKAAAWHKGTPTAIRGNWNKTRYIHYGNQYFHNDFYFSITKNRFVAGAQVADPYNISHVHYKKTGKYTYLLKGKELYSRKWQNTKVVATKHKIKYRVLAPYSMRMPKYSVIAYR